MTSAIQLLASLDAGGTQTVKHRPAGTATPRNPAGAAQRTCCSPQPHAAQTPRPGASGRPVRAARPAKVCALLWAQHNLIAIWAGTADDSQSRPIAFLTGSHSNSACSKSFPPAVASGLISTPAWAATRTGQPRPGLACCSSLASRALGRQGIPRRPSWPCRSPCGARRDRGGHLRRNDVGPRLPPAAVLA
jgi:hypothetical protein